MEIFGLDIETTGPSIDDDQILHIAMVYFNSALEEHTGLENPVCTLPRWEALIRPRRVEGDVFAINMNKILFEALAEPLEPSDPYDDSEPYGRREYNGRSIPVFPTPGDALERLYDEKTFPIRDHWTQGRRKAVIAGKNVAGFDVPFIVKKCPAFRGRVHHRMIDVGSMAMGYSISYWSRTEPPSLSALAGRKVAHDALDDVFDVIDVIRIKLHYLKRR